MVCILTLNSTTKQCWTVIFTLIMSYNLWINLNYIGLINISSALLFIVISVPLVKQKISMNNLYGFRIKRAFESDENWFKINTYGGKQLISWSIPLIIIGIFCFFFPFESDRKDIMAIF